MDVFGFILPFFLWCWTATQSSIVRQSNLCEETLRLITTIGRLRHDFDLLELGLTEDLHFLRTACQPGMLNNLIDV